MNAVLLTVPRYRAVDSTGVPLNGALLYCYAAGSLSTLQNTYSDNALTTPNANPVVADTAGLFGPIYPIPGSSYQFVLKTSAGVQVWSQDNCANLLLPSVLSKAGNYTVATTDGVDVLVEVTASGSYTITLYTAVGNTGKVVRVKKIDSSATPVTIACFGSETIDGVATASVSGQWSVLSLMSNGATWDVVSNTSAGNASIGVVEGRLTLTSGTPVTTADVTGATSIYFTPYKGNRIALYDGTGTWNTRTFTEITIPLGTITSGLPYDLFAYDNAGVVTFDSPVAWTSGTTRATALTLQNGVLVKTGATTRRYIGTFYTTATTTTEDSYAKRFLFNYYNRVRRPMFVASASDSWTYTTATVRQWQGSASNQIAFVIGWAEIEVEAEAQVTVTNTNAAVSVAIGVAIDSTTAFPSSGWLGGSLMIPLANSTTPITTSVRAIPAVGYHYAAALETSAATGTTTWTSDSGSPLARKSGIAGITEG